MFGKTLKLLSLGAALGILSGCLGTGDDVKSPSDSAGGDPTIEATVRKAAGDAEATYRYAEAAQHYTTLLEKHPDSQDLVLAVARNLRYSGAPQRSIQIVNQHLAKSKSKAPLLIELGKDYLASDQVTLALTVLAQAKEADANNWQVFSAIGVAQDYQGNYKDAQATYEMGLKLSPNNATLLNNYGLSQAQSGQLDAAISTLQMATEQPDASVQTRQNLALMLALKGDKEGATRLVKADLPPDMAQNNVSYYQEMNQ